MMIITVMMPVWPGPVTARVAELCGAMAMGSDSGSEQTGIPSFTGPGKFRADSESEDSGSESEYSLAGSDHEYMRVCDCICHGQVRIRDNLRLSELCPLQVPMITRELEQ
jgi:hypothetical protein